MREILFRGLQMFKEEDVWVYGYLKIGDIAGTRTAFIIPADFDKCPIKEEPVIDITVGQYTGLKDKNGVKIFEGDIVDVDKALVSGRFWVEYGRSGAFIVKDEDGRKYFLGECNATVVGNIYENPSLLRGGEREDVQENG